MDEQWSYDRVRFVIRAHGPSGAGPWCIACLRQSNIRVRQGHCDEWLSAVQALREGRVKT